jgi:hypothetical protein
LLRSFEIVPLEVLFKGAVEKVDVLYKGYTFGGGACCRGFSYIVIR